MAKREVLCVYFQYFQKEEVVTESVGVIIE
jgi:hypothetical protein